MKLIFHTKIKIENKSQPIWAAWIEIKETVLAKGSIGLSQPIWAAWIEIGVPATGDAPGGVSHSSRSAWIKITSAA